MIYLALIPATIVFCFLIFLFIHTLPNQVKSSDFGKRIWPYIYRPWNFLFLAISFCLISCFIVRPFAVRLGYFNFVSWTEELLFLPSLFLSVSFLLLIALVIILKFLQLCQIIR